MAIKKPEDKKDQPKNPVEKNVFRSTEIPVDDKSTDETEKIQVDFEDEDLANSFAAQQTKPSNATADVDQNKSIEDIQREVTEYENAKSGKLEYKDLYKQAEFLITILDTGFSTVFKLIAKGKHASEYEMPASNKRILTEQLTLILAKYQSRFKVEYMFFVGLLALYIPMGVGAVQNRKQVIAEQKKPKEQKQIQEREPKDQYYRHEEGKEPVETIKKEATPLEKVEVPGKKPGRKKRAY